MRWIRIAGLLSVTLGAASFAEAPSCADSWPLPTQATVVSCSAQTRAVVTPRDLESQLDYFEDKVKGTEPAGQRAAGEQHPSARVERRVGGVWRSVWEAPLVNDVAPASVLIRDDASRLVTLDDWHSVGHGPNTVVVYGPGGELRYRRALGDIVPQWYADAMPHSVSSIEWRREATFSRDGRLLLLPIVVPTRERPLKMPTVILALDLDDGSVAPLDPDAWRRALATGRHVRAERIAAEKAAAAAFRAPLLGPPGNKEREWHAYLREAVARRLGDGESTATKVLRSPDAPDYAASVGFLRGAFTDRFSDRIAVASIKRGTLAAVLRGIAAATRRGALAPIDLYVAAPDDEWPAIVDAMAGTGVTLIQLNPATPIPQRPERLARRFGP